jgi:hypothetical protein
LGHPAAGDERRNVVAKPGRLRVNLAESVEKNEARLNDRVHELAPHKFQWR